VCGNPARTDLGGGRSVMTVPTALRSETYRFGPDPDIELSKLIPAVSQTNASPFWIMLLPVWGRLDNGMIPFWQGGRFSR
jgi:hypothetical protein